MNTTEIATAFVDLALKHDWNTVKELPACEVEILFAAVSAAGFEPEKVVPGKLFGNYRDQDGSSTGETYPINSSCPYRVINREGENHYHATEWLDSALRYAQEKKDRQYLVEVIAREIERSVPLKPIQLTSDDDLLREYPPSGSYSVNHTRDDRDLGSCVGVHDYCNGWVDRRRATKTHDALVCRACHLRILFPKEIKIYGELRQYLSSKFVQTQT